MATQQNITINDDSENGLTKAMMLLYRAIRQRFPTRTNNRLSVSSNVVQSGLIDVQGKKNENVGGNVGNAGNHPQNVGYIENVEINLPMLRKIQQDMKESFNKNLQEIKKVVVILHPGGLFANENEHAFMLRKQCEAFLTNGNLKSLDSSMINYYLKVFQEYTRHDIKSIKNMLICYLNAIEKEIDARAHNEEELWIKQRDVKEKRDNERMMQPQEGMVNMVKDKCNVGLVVMESSRTELENSKVETNQCDEAKVKVNFYEIETKNIELEHQVASLIKENEHLKLVYKNLFDSIKKSRVQIQKENLRSTLSEFTIVHILGKDGSSSSSIVESHISELEKESWENNCKNAKCELRTKIVELEKVLTQKTKDFDDVKLELSNRTAKFESYFEKLKNMKVVLERQLARKVDDSKAEKDHFLKEINHLRAQLENLKGKFVETKFDKPSILGKPRADKLSTFKIVVYS
ncbi:hypothetical protein Tco_1249459 [Tanacetum coccineum]